MPSFVQAAFRYLENMNSQSWLFVGAGVVVVGLICMRGFGSRSSY